MKYTTLITDFDNTLYDWVEVWSASFHDMLKELEPFVKVPRDELLRAIRSIHQQHGTSEYAYLLNELDADRFFVGDDKQSVLSKAAQGYQRGRSRSLKLYPGVKETLLKLKRKGIPIIIYTESLEIYTNGRIIDLGLDGVVDVVYSPPNHELLSDHIGAISLLGSGQRQLEKTKHRYLPAGVKKPNPEVLNDILVEVGASADDTLYVGDSALKDVAMAKAVGVMDVLARYGRAQEREDYNILRLVSHWPDNDVEKERTKLADPEDASLIIDRFDELLGYFT